MQLFYLILDGNHSRTICYVQPCCFLQIHYYCENVKIAQMFSINLFTKQIYLKMKSEYHIAIGHGLLTF